MSKIERDNIYERTLNANVDVDKMMTTIINES